LDDAAIIDLIPMRAKLVERFREVNECTWNAATQPSPDGTPFTAEVMICSIYQQCALAIAEKLQIPMFLYSAFPVLETDEFRNPVGIIMSAKTTGHKIGNKMSWGLNDKMTSMGFQRAMRDFRTKHGLPKTKESVTLQSTCNELRIPSFGIWSPNILQKPADWHENALVLGALKGSGGLGDTLPEELEKYLQESEEQPVFFGFGSMANQKSLQNVWTQIDQVCRNMEIKRAIFHVSPQDKKFIKQPLPEGIFLLDKPVNHGTLFKRCSAVVHHGGAGTVQTGLSSGKPTGILSFACDQPFWGEVVQSGKFGATCTARSCSVSKLTKIMNVLFDEETKTKCEDIAYRLSVEPDATEAFVHELYARLPKTGMKIDYRAMKKNDKWKKTWDQSHRLGVAPPLYRKNYTNIHKSKHWLFDKLSRFGA